MAKSTGSSEATPTDSPRRSRSRSVGSKTLTSRSSVDKFLRLSSESIPENTSVESSESTSESTTSEMRVIMRTHTIRGEALSSSEDSTPSGDTLPSYSSSNSAASSPQATRPRGRIPVHIGETIQEEPLHSEIASDSKVTICLDIPVTLFRLDETNETPRGNGVILWCKDFRRIIFDFVSPEDKEKFVGHINSINRTHELKRNFQCFQLPTAVDQIKEQPEQEQEQMLPIQRLIQQQKQLLQQQKMQILQQRNLQRRISQPSKKDITGQLRTSSVERCVVFNFREELRRHGQEWRHLKHENPGLPWSINLTANYKFQLCKYYPRALVLPTAISLLSNKKLHKIAEHYIGNQLPVLVWSCIRGCAHDHPPCGSVLLRANRRREIAHAEEVHAIVLDSLWMSIGYKRVSLLVFRS